MGSRSVVYMQEGELACRSQSSVNKAAFPWWRITIIPLIILKYYEIKKKTINKINSYLKKEVKLDNLKNKKEKEGTY
jgi:hypothetical protein